MQAMMIVMSLMLAAGCGAAGAEDQRGPVEPVSGSRLVVEAWDGADGSRLPVGLYDRELGVRCAPGLAADGVTRCLPVGAVPFEEVERHTDVWADSSRSTPAWATDLDLGFYWMPQEGDVPSFLCIRGVYQRLAVRRQGTTCGAEFFEVVDVLEAHAEWGPTDPEGIVTIGAEIPPSRFVEMTLTR